MAAFLSVFNDLYKNTNNDPNSTAPVTQCTTKIPHQEFHIFLLIPSSLMILLLAFTIQRRNKLMGCLDGRPGTVFPMDILGRSNRFSYVAAWGAVAYLAADVVFEQKFALRLEGKSYVTAANGLLSMMIYGLDYFPMFAALALDSVIGYLVGTAYAWFFLAVTIYKETECDLVYQARLLLLLRDLPRLVCLGYLSISLPVRTVLACYHQGRGSHLLKGSEMVSILNMAKHVGNSPEAHHVQKLLRMPTPPRPEDGILPKIRNMISTVVKKLIYHRSKDFRYSSRVLSVMFMGALLLYKTTLELMTGVLALLTLVEDGFITTLTIIGWEDIPDEGEEISTIRQYTYFLYYLLIAGRGCFIASIIGALVLGLIQILHMLSSYRNNLFDLYKGDNTHIPHRDTRSNTSLLVGTMRYAGYQVGYIAWGFAIHFLILMIVSLALATIITMIRWDLYQWMIDVIVNVWPVVLVTVIVMLGQILLAKFVFLQENGAILAINNRRMLFIGSFFLFFYNIFIGLVSCLLRILKSVLVGALFLSRLDNSALPRRFQMFDPGFAAYVGFIHIEAVHSHPVMLVFLRFLMLDLQIKDRAGRNKDTRITIDSKEKYTENKARPKNTQARNKWHLMYTLYSNPQIRTYRKQYIRYIKDLQERLARKYNLSTNAMGSLMSNMQAMQVSVTEIDAKLDDVTQGEGLSQVNWDALMGMNRFRKFLKQNQTPEIQGNGVRLELRGLSGNINPAFTNSASDDTARTGKQLWSRLTITKDTAPQQNSVTALQQNSDTDPQQNSGHSAAF